MLTFAFKFEMGEHIKKLKYISHRKLIDPMYLLVKMISVLFFGVGWLTNRANMRSPLVLIEAGIKGWETLFFSELLHSSPEYFGSERVRTSSIDKVQGLSSFLCEVVRFLVVGEIDAAGEHDRERV